LGKGPSPHFKSNAEAIGEADDELWVLESRDPPLASILDMAVYNNIFNPIKAEGSSCNQELVRSYSIRRSTTEYKASLVTLDALIELAK
jgi:hypothetical protein